MSGQIFISYRREESRWSARSLYDRLSGRFDRKQIFMDIDAIALGDDFVKAIEKTVGECDVLIAVIGAHWVTSTDEQNGRRLDNPEDFVRREIATALKRDIRVIPVLVDGALMPRSSELPDDLKPLVRRNALRVSDTGFDDDCRRLVAAIEQVLAERHQREEKERLERKPHTPPPGPGAPSTSPSKIKLRPVVGIVALLALVICLLVGAAVYFGSQPPEPNPTTPKAAGSPVAVLTPSTEISANPTAPHRGALVTQGGALIAAPTVEEKTPSTSEAVQPSPKPTTPVSRGTLLIH
jgi:TIR domain